MDDKLTEKDKNEKKKKQREKQHKNKRRFNPVEQSVLMCVLF